MIFPNMPIIVTLPEGLGYIDNVIAKITLCSKQIDIPCKHTSRYHSDSELAWPELFDELSNPLLLNKKILDNKEPNTSVFIGIYTFYDESYLKGSYYFVFDYNKNGQWYRNCHTNPKCFEQNLQSYYYFLEELNKNS